MAGLDIGGIVGDVVSSVVSDVVSSLINDFLSTLVDAASGSASSSFAQSQQKQLIANMKQITKDSEADYRKSDQRVQFAAAEAERSRARRSVVG